MASAQLNMFETEEESALIAITIIKSQLDSFRKKVFSEIGELKKENEFLSLQLQMMIEERDGNFKGG